MKKYWNRSILWLAPVLSAVLLSCGASPAEKKTAPPPWNFVLVSLDTLRADHLGLYGYKADTSPQLDALAKKGVVFDFALAQSSHTYPSHQSLLQSCLVSHCPSSTSKVAQVFRANGYKTAAFTGGARMSQLMQTDMGFDDLDEDFFGFVTSFPKIEEWIRENSKTPFFLFLHTYDIHLPYDPPPPFDTMFYPDYQGSVDGKSTRDLIRKINHIFEFSDFTGEVHLTEEDRRKVISLYDGGIRYTDQFFGRLVEILKREGLWDRTVLVVFADHGEEFWDHGSVNHGLTLYQEMLRVPLFFRLPRNRRGGTRVSEPVRLLDVAPTLLSLARLPPPPEFSGRSLLPLLLGEESPGPPILSEIGSARSLVEYPWKAILHVQTQQVQLFNLRDDPGEQKDVAENHPEKAAELVATIRKMLAAAPQTAPPPVNSKPGEIQDEELRKQLEALGYLG